MQIYSDFFVYVSFSCLFTFILGYDLNLFDDPVYFMGPKDQTYKLLTVDVMNQIQSNLMSAKL